MLTEQEVNDLRRRVTALEQRERESDLELRAALLQIVAQIERKHQIGKYAKPTTPQRSRRPQVDQKGNGI